jgi:hypothetical protein
LYDDSYFITKNKFKINYIKIGPFPNEQNINFELSSLEVKGIQCPNSTVQKVEEAGNIFYILVYNTLKYILNIRKPITIFLK